MWSFLHFSVQRMLIDQLHSTSYHGNIDLGFFFNELAHSQTLLLLSSKWTLATKTQLSRKTLTPQLIVELLLTIYKDTRQDSFYV